MLSRVGAVARRSLRWTCGRQRSSCDVISSRAWHEVSWRPGVVQVSRDVSERLGVGEAVVALESTIITHGMSYPNNVEVALAVEAEVRGQGAFPATIAILNGQIKVGLSKEEIDFLGSSTAKAVKTSRRDLPYVLANGLNGGTTVSATMIAAHAAGIPIFVTGGIGGVHRMAKDKVMDISADLTELGRTPIAVVCAGIKSILDIPNSLQFLETQGVCVLSYGSSLNFPGFFSSDSGCQAPYNVDTPLKAAQIIDQLHSLRLESGCVIAVPIPREHSMSKEAIDRDTETALLKARELNICGKDLTPFLLKSINESTLGRSQRANEALIRNNARIGGRIAVELATLNRQPLSSSAALHECPAPNRSRRRDHTRMADKAPSSQTIYTQTPMSPPPPIVTASSPKTPPAVATAATNRPVVIGGSNVDFLVQILQDQIEPHGSTNYGRIDQTFGGVGRNVADALSRLGQNPLFVSTIGDDHLGDQLLATNPKLNTVGVNREKQSRTATYCVVLERSGDVHLGIGDMQIHDHITRKQVSMFEGSIKSAPLVVFDGNVPIDTMNYIMDLCLKYQVAVWFEPTDTHKAGYPFQSNRWQNLTYVSPNFNELRHINATVTGNFDLLDRKPINKSPLDVLLNECVDLTMPLMQHVECAVVTLGEYGIIVARNCDSTQLFPTKRGQLRKGETSVVYYPGLPSDVVSVSGAGDCLAAAMMAGIIGEKSPDECIRAGLRAAQLSLLSRQPVPSTLSHQAVFTQEQIPPTAGWKPRVLK